MGLGAEVSSAFVSLMPSARGFGRATEQQVGREVDTAGKSLGKRLGTAMKVGAVGALAGVVLAGGFIKGAIQDASDLNEANSKVGVVFGKQAAQIRKASKTSAQAMGLSKEAYLESAGTLGNLLVSLDIAPKKAAGLSKEMVKLAGDLASFNNASPEEALDALRSGLTGETEPLKRFGVNMNDATLHAEALKLGLIKNIKDGLTPQAKALAAQSLIMSQTKTAQGDFARTSGGLANQQRILSAEITDVKSSLGKVFYPVATKVFGFLTKDAIPAVGNVGDAFKKLRRPLGNAAGFISDAAGDIKDFFTTGAGNTALEKSLGFVKDTAGDISDAFGNAADSIGKVSTAAQDIDLGNIDGKTLGKTLGTAFIEGIGFLAKSTGQITSAIGDVMHNVDWVGVGIDIGKQAPALLLGLVTGILNFDMGSLLKGIGDHWFEILIGILTIAFAPSKFLGPVEKILTKIPFVGRFLAAAVRWLNQLGGKLKGFGADLFRSFAEGFGRVRFPGAGLVSRVLGGFKLLPKRILDFWLTLETRLGVWALDAMEGAGRGTRAGVAKLIRFFLSIPGKLLKAIGNPEKILYDAGVKIIQGLINGITSKISELGSKLKELGSFIKDHKGPPSADKVMLRPAGRLIIGGLIDGLDDGLPDLERQLRTVTHQIQGTAPALAASVAASGAGTSTLSAGARLRLVVDGREFSAYVDDRADTRIDAADAMAGMAERAFQ